MLEDIEQCPIAQNLFTGNTSELIQEKEEEAATANGHSELAIFTNYSVAKPLVYQSNELPSDEHFAHPWSAEGLDRSELGGKFRSYDGGGDDDKLVRKRKNQIVDDVTSLDPGFDVNLEPENLGCEYEDTNCFCIGDLFKPHNPQVLPYQAKVANFVDFTGNVKIPVRFVTDFEGKHFATTMTSLGNEEGALSIPIVLEGDLTSVVTCHVKEYYCVFVSGYLNGQTLRWLLSVNFREFHVIAENIKVVVGFENNILGKKIGVGELDKLRDRVGDDVYSYQVLGVDVDSVKENSSCIEVVQELVVMELHENGSNTSWRSDSKMKYANHTMDLWINLANALEWWDYHDHKRNGLVNEKFPDFKLKVTEEFMWISSAPKWILHDLRKLDYIQGARTRPRRRGKGVAIVKGNTTDVAFMVNDLLNLLIGGRCIWCAANAKTAVSIVITELVRELPLEESDGYLGTTKWNEFGFSSGLKPPSRYSIVMRARAEFKSEEHDITITELEILASSEGVGEAILLEGTELANQRSTITRRLGNCSHLCFAAFLLCNMNHGNLNLAILPMSKECKWNGSIIGLTHSFFSFWDYLFIKSLETFGNIVFGMDKFVVMWSNYWGGLEGMVSKLEFSDSGIHLDEVKTIEMFDPGIKICFSHVLLGENIVGFTPRTGILTIFTNGKGGVLDYFVMEQLEPPCLFVFDVEKLGYKEDVAYVILYHYVYHLKCSPTRGYIRARLKSGEYAISPFNQGKHSFVKHMLATDGNVWKSYLWTSSAISITDTDSKIHIVKRGRLAQDAHNQIGIAHNGGILPLLKLLEQIKNLAIYNRMSHLLFMGLARSSATYIWALLDLQLHMSRGDTPLLRGEYCHGLGNGLG